MVLDTGRIRAICFDIDGTLSDTDDQVARQLTKTLARLRFLFPKGDPRRLARRLVMATETPGNFLLGLPDRLGLDGPLARLGDGLYRLGLGRSGAGFWLLPGIPDLLRGLQPRYPLSIVSARGQRTTQRFLDQFELAPYFTTVATAQTCRHTKPYPDPIVWAAGQMGVKPQECLMVGDTPVDVRAARAAGAQLAAVLCGFGYEDELRRAGADLLLPTTADLLPILVPSSTGQPQAAMSLPFSTGISR